MNLILPFLAKHKHSILGAGLIFTLVTFLGCDKKPNFDKGFSVLESNQAENTQDTVIKAGNYDALETQPGTVLLTGTDKIRLIPVFKVNINKTNGERYVGKPQFYTNYDETYLQSKNYWHDHIVPGFEAAYGFNLLNIAVAQEDSVLAVSLFEPVVLINTIYYPSFDTDTLNYKPIKRNYFLLTVYDEDTNKDGFIDNKDMRRMYYFNIYGSEKIRLIPQDYSVFKSTYDEANDWMFLYAKLDENKNGRADDSDPIHVFRLALESGKQVSVVY